MKQLKPPFMYEPYCQSILNVEGHKVIDIRGWGFIQKLPNAEEVQDQFGKHVTDLLNLGMSADDILKLKRKNDVST